MNLRLKNIVFILCLFFTAKASTQTYPTYGPEIPVTVTGLGFDAMEPAITADGNVIFFNSLNDGVATSLYYASRVNDSTFTFVGGLTGANQNITPRMDVVASSDSINRFYWMSLRDFPIQFDNFFRGQFNGTDVVNIGRVHGTFYIYSLGWLIMDAAINYDGNTLYYCNAFFNSNYSGCNGLPCIAKLGIAQKQNDSTFNKLSNSDNLMLNVNDTNYAVYAPHISRNGLELYYTRFFRTNPVQTELCVSVRNTTNDPFSLPSVIYASGLAPEAISLTTDYTKIYYHKKVNGIYRLFMRYRTSVIGLDETVKPDLVQVYPNPVVDFLELKLLHPEQPSTVKIYTSTGQLVLELEDPTHISVAALPKGIYWMTVQQGDFLSRHKFVKI
ncbi:MAG: T9SS type A sorting domain-containing protein [Bacteroidia bacterium]